MALVTLLFSPLLIFAAYEKKHKDEKLYLIKLLSIWLLCQFYIVIGAGFRFPVGAFSAVFLIYHPAVNIQSKKKSFAIGVLSLILSSAIYIVSSIYS